MNQENRLYSDLFISNSYKKNMAIKNCWKLFVLILILLLSFLKFLQENPLYFIQVCILDEQSSNDLWKIILYLYFFNMLKRWMNGMFCFVEFIFIGLS